jgi:hypothetical protein
MVPLSVCLTSRKSLMFAPARLYFCPLSLWIVAGVASDCAASEMRRQYQENLMPSHLVVQGHELHPWDALY